MSSLQLPQLPDSLKSLKPYLRLATLHEDRDLVIAYWCRLEAIQQGLRISTKSMQETQFFMSIMNWLEKTKKENSDNEAITNEIVAQAHLENWALKLFLYADENDRAGVFNKNVINAFYTSSMIYQLLKTFGPLNEVDERNMKYAKWKTVYITNCLKKGETPISGPLANMEQNEDELNTDFNEESEEIAEVIDGEHLDAVAMNFSEDNIETKEDNDNPEAESGDQTIEEAKEENENGESEENKEDNGENEILTDENGENGKDEDKEDEEIPTEIEADTKEEENEEPETEKKKDEDNEETEKSVAESEEENNDEAKPSNETDFVFPSVPSSSTDKGTKEPNSDSSAPATPNQYNPAPTPTNGGNSCSFDKDNLTIKTEGGVELTTEQMVRAQKLIKWAGSALNYDDVPTAVTNLRQALNLLVTGQEHA